MVIYIMGLYHNEKRKQVIFPRRKFEKSDGAGLGGRMGNEQLTENIKILEKML